MFYSYLFNIPNLDKIPTFYRAQTASVDKCPSCIGLLPRIWTSAFVCSGVLLQIYANALLCIGLNLQVLRNTVLRIGLIFLIFQISYFA